MLHILECNYLTVLLKPVYEKPIDTAEDIIERGIQVIGSPGSESLVDVMKESPYEITREYAENILIPEVDISFQTESIFYLMIGLG